MSDYTSKARAVLIDLRETLKRERDKIDDDRYDPYCKRDYRMGFIGGLEAADVIVAAFLNRIKDEDEDTAARVLYDYFYGDACGAFDEKENEK